MPGRYSRTAIVLHWLIAAMMIANVALALAWPHVADEAVRPMINGHKSIGITVLLLAICRLLWRLTHRPPPLPAAYRPWEARLAQGVHIGLYLVMFVMPLTGWIMDSAWERAAENPNVWFGLFEWPRIAPVMTLGAESKKQVHDLFGAGHAIAAYVLYALVLLHVAGALKHQFQGHRELARMGLGRPV